MMIEFGTKSKTLQLLEGKISHARVLPQVSFSVSEWKAQKSMKSTVKDMSKYI